MGDDGHELEFGCFLTPRADRPAELLDLATLADEIGLDLLSVQDHPYQPLFLDAWTLLSVLAARTLRIRVLPYVANLPLHPPAVLARSVASLDILSGGRVELGLGSGAFWDGIVAMGGRRLAPGESGEALEEAIGVLRALWHPGDPVHLDGTHYPVDGAAPGPFLMHDVGIWLGASLRPR